MKVFFYPHTYLRDRQLDVVRLWPPAEVINPGIAENRKGDQVGEDKAKAPRIRLSWKQKLPFLNVKFRPREAPVDGVVYVWGALIATGRFIVDLDNPWSLVGYNLKSMSVYRWLIKRVLLSRRCVEIRCMSEACRRSLKALFGDRVYAKASVHYPRIPQVVSSIENTSDGCRFLFVGTQFEIKGGEALLRAFRRVYQRRGNCRLDVITHFPTEFLELVNDGDGIVVHKAVFSRDEIHDLFMRHADVLILPTYVESFGLVALEALAHGLALIATDVYALNELVEDGVNGALLAPPLSIWDGVVPSAAYHDLANIKDRIRNVDTQDFELKLEEAMERFVVDPIWRRQARQESVSLMSSRFVC